MISKIIWITGAGSGIGKSVAKAYDEDQNIIILSGRNQANLQQVSSELQCKSIVEVLDVTNENEVINSVNKVISELGRIDILVNNAGVSQRSLAMETTNDVGKSLMDVNFYGAVYMTKALLPQFTRNNKGDIVVISSLSGKFGFPQRSFYAASKHALHGYFESLSLELHTTDINVLMVCPGRIKTDISLNALKGDGSSHGVMDSAQRKGMSAERCATLIKKAVARKKKEIYIGGSETLMIYIKRYLPALFRFIAVRIKPNS